MNGKLYIGVTKNLQRRWTVHCSKHSQCKRLKAAIIKYGRDAFQKEVICIGLKDYILDLEEKMIAAYDTTNTGYNICKGGKDYPSEHSIPNESMISPVYVSGFWFPLREIALVTLNLKINTFYKWQREGTLGNVTRRKPGDEFKKSPPVYIKGFWFPSRNLAREILNISSGQAHRLSKIKDCELEDMTFERNKRHPRPTSKAVYINSILYVSVREAARTVGISNGTIKRRIENNWEGYKYADPL